MHETISLAGLLPGLCCFPVNSGGEVLTSSIPGYLPPTISYSIAQPENHPAKLKR